MIFELRTDGSWILSINYGKSIRDHRTQLKDNGETIQAPLINFFF